MVDITSLSLERERATRMARCILIISDYSNNIPVADIQAKFDCSRHTVLRLARAAGLAKRPKHFPEKTKQAVKTLLSSNRKYHEIKALLGVSMGYISKVAKEMANASSK